MVSPGRKLSRPGLSWSMQSFGKRTCKPNSVVCGHSSRRRVAADAHQRPTRRFRHQLHASRLGASGRCAAPPGSGGRFPPYLVLLRVGFTLPRPLPPGGALLPHHFTLTPALGLAVQANPFAAFQGRPPGRGVAEAVSFLWHWPSMGLEAHVPDVIRHTALRSSDFPPPDARLPRASGSDRPVLLPVSSLPRILCSDQLNLQ